MPLSLSSSWLLLVVANTSTLWNSTFQIVSLRADQISVSNFKNFPKYLKQPRLCFCLRKRTFFRDCPNNLAPRSTKLPPSAIGLFWKSGWLICKSVLVPGLRSYLMRSPDDLKVPRKLNDVTNISICTENRTSKSVYSERFIFVF